jgi:hypothetical protein
MNITRKDFLRLSGLSLLAFAGKKAVQAVTGLTSAPATAAAAPSKAVRWGMVIDLGSGASKPAPSAAAMPVARPTTSLESPIRPAR